MEEKEAGLEEGEISDDSDSYVVLERPANYSVSQPCARFSLNLPSESDEELQSSESDSDSDPNTRKNKKPKIKLKLKPKPRQEDPKRKKYDIWSTRAQDEALAKTLNNCDVTTKDRSRNVETYDYTLAHKYYELEKRQNNKRRRDDRNNANFFRQRKRSPSVEKLKGVSRVILDLNVDLNSSVEEMAKDIANKLCEEKEDLIQNVINVMGKQKTLDIFKETKKIEEEGGMLIMNQTRRRTPGGVFLYLVRHDYHITLEQKNKIFQDERQKSKQLVKNKQKQKNRQLKCQIAIEKSKLLPDLLTRAELLACQNPTRKIKDETEETDFVNPPPTPETDGHENSGDGMDDVPLPVVNGNDSLESVRGKLNPYEEDFLDIECSNDMDLF